jgi:hypothetical protein
MYEPSGVTDTHWDNYSKFLKELKRGIEGLKELGIPTMYKGLYYKKLIMHSLRQVNLFSDKAFRLQTLWDKLKVRKPIAAYSKYVRDNQAI